MRKTKLQIALLAAVLAAPMGFSLPASAQVQIGVVIPAPPPPRREVVPPPRRGYVWSPGHWEWRRNHHVWVNGFWVRERRGYAYRPPEWRQEGDRWVYGAPRWDRDGDGIPNRQDRHPNNPYRN